MLGSNVLAELDHAAQHLLAPDAVAIPAKVTVHATLLELGPSTAAGFDVSPLLLRYAWHPGIAAVDLNRCVRVIVWLCGGGGVFELCVEQTGKCADQHKVRCQPPHAHNSCAATLELA